MHWKNALWLPFVVLFCTLAAAAAPAVAAPAPASPGADYVWIEAEQYDECNFRHFEKSSMGKPQLLSGGEWIMNGLQGDDIRKLVPDEGIVLKYRLDVPRTGKYRFWARVGWYSARAEFEWRVGGAGRGQGGGAGRGGGAGAGAGGGRGRMGGFGGGPGGNCVCPKCGKKAQHQRGVPCYQQKCPDCGTQMVREKT